MKSIITWFTAMIFAIPSFAQCTVEAAAKLPYSCVQTNSYKYIGTKEKENKANTELMYNKILILKNCKPCWINKLNNSTT